MSEGPALDSPGKNMKKSTALCPLKPIARTSSNLAILLISALLSGCQLVLDIDDPGPARPYCGDGRVDRALGEQCDVLEDSPLCDPDCTTPSCGDGVHNPLAGELCDDGNQVAGDGCSADCQSDETCGNGILDDATDELCDDGNRAAADGCSPDCQPEYCGDGVVGPGELCDDGNLDAGDGCSSDCQSDETCGNDIVDVVTGEDCDDGNLDDKDWCTSACAVADCRDGILDGDEQDVDCGGHCGPGSCAREQLCVEHSDCRSGWCHNGSCGAIGQIVAGGDHTCALLATGAVRCWGTNYDGQLGYAHTEHIGDNETPASSGDVQLGGTAIQLAAGSYHTCALLDSGAVRCWGRGSYGQLGYGDTNNIGDDEHPAVAGDVFVGAPTLQLTAGEHHTCVLLVTGAVRCWGAGWRGQLGYGDTSDIGDDELPASAGDVDVGGTVVHITAGNMHTCALLNNGTIRCWGAGWNSQLGHGGVEDIGDDESPASAGDVPVGGTAIQLAAGGQHTCALLDNAALRCWGDNHYGQLGYGNQIPVGHDNIPSDAGDVPVGRFVRQVAAGRHNTCAVLDTDTVRCWGEGSYGQLGYGNTYHIGDDEFPSVAGDIDVGAPTLQITTGTHHTCAVLATGAIRCWGPGWNGRLGYGNTVFIGNDELPSSAGDVDVGASIL